MKPQTVLEALEAFKLVLDIAIQLWMLLGPWVQELWVYLRA